MFISRFFIADLIFEMQNDLWLSLKYVLTSIITYVLYTALIRDISHIKTNVDGAVIEVEIV